MKLVYRSLLVTLLLFLSLTPLFAESAADSSNLERYTPTKELTLYGRDVSGPRIGLTYIAVQSDDAQESLDKYELDPLMLQVGWHFDWMAFEPGDAPAVFVEFIPLLGALEQGVFLPSLSMAMGVRTYSGFEVGVGPNVTPTGVALVVGVGHNFGSGGISMPVNLAIARNRDAVRVTLLVGYGISWGSRN
ncbi:hypothetical protein KQI63_14860 [bacterium]|nr:hypothetical protein [bacterium]